jgi:hypothetical protein
MYNDEYMTCSETYATLRIIGLKPDEVTRDLGLRPTDSCVRGDVRHAAPVRHDGWFLRSKDAVDSKDVRRHLDWILDQIATQRDALSVLVDRGAKIDITCYWVSAHGHGGPIISFVQSKKLADLEIDVSFDVYFGAPRKAE